MQAAFPSRILIKLGFLNRPGSWNTIALAVLFLAYVGRSALAGPDTDAGGGDASDVFTVIPAIPILFGTILVAQVDEFITRSEENAPLIGNFAHTIPDILFIFDFDHQEIVYLN